MADGRESVEAALPSSPGHGVYPKSERKNRLSFEPYYHGLCSFSKKVKEELRVTI